MPRVIFKLPVSCGLVYHGITYPEHERYALDLNRGWGSTDEGDRVLCSLQGVVTSAGGPYGVVVVRHLNGYTTLYGHLASIRVRIGQEVATLQQLGVIGRTYPPPRVLSPHLHYQQLRYGRPIRVTFDAVAYAGSVEHASHVLYGPPIEGSCP